MPAPEEVAEPHLVDDTTYSPGRVFRRTAYRPQWPYNLPSHNSKTVLSTVKKGPPYLPNLRCAKVLGGWPVFRYSR